MIIDRDYLNPEKSLKAFVRQRFGGLCIYCGEKPVHITCDHVIPLCKNGEHSIRNLAPACRKCNSDKGNLPVYDWWADQPFWSYERAKVLEEMRNPGLDNDELIQGFL